MTEGKFDGRRSVLHCKIGAKMDCGLFFPPSDHRMKKAGWVNMMSVKQRGSFQHLRQLEWDWYTELVLRVRGDGRTYMLNIQV